MMIPLSYSTIFGGTCTIVGTSTNLIVVGLVYQIDPNLRFPFFEVMHPTYTDAKQLH